MKTPLPDQEPGDAVRRAGQFSERKRATFQRESTWNNQGVVLTLLGREERALKAYEKCINLSPDYYVAWGNKGIVLLSLDRHEQALRSIRKAIRLYPHEPGLWVHNGVALFKLDAYLQALKSFERAIELESELAGAWNNKGVVLDMLGRSAEALVAFEKAISPQPDSVLPRANKAAILLKLGDSRRASAMVDTIFQMQGNLACAYVLKGRIAMENGQYRDAIVSLENAVRLDYGNPKPLVWLAYIKHLGIEFQEQPTSVNRSYRKGIFTIIRELERAERLARGYRETHWYECYILYYLGSLYFGLDDFLSAKEKLASSR